MTTISEFRDKYIVEQNDENLRKYKFATHREATKMVKKLLVDIFHIHKPSVRFIKSKNTWVIEWEMQLVNAPIWNLVGRNLTDIIEESYLLIDDLLIPKGSESLVLRKLDSDFIETSCFYFENLKDMFVDGEKIKLDTTSDLHRIYEVKKSIKHQLRGLYCSPYQFVEDIVSKSTFPKGSVLLSDAPKYFKSEKNEYFTIPYKSESFDNELCCVVHY